MLRALRTYASGEVEAEFRREELTSREALTMVRLFRAFDPTPMLDRPGGHLAVPVAGKSQKVVCFPPSICPTVFGGNCLIGMF